MLTGIKKVKANNSQQQQATQKSLPVYQNWDIPQQSQKLYELDVQQKDAKLFTGNQNAIKQQFIMEDQGLGLQNQEEIAEQPYGLKVMNAFGQLQSSMKMSALQIMEIYGSGDVQALEKGLDKFSQMQASYQQSLAHNQSQRKSQKVSPELTRQEVTIGHAANQQQQPNAKPQKGQKGRFQYNYNYQQSSQDQKHKKSLKRSHRSRPIMKSERIQDYCMHCPDNQELRLLSASNYVYLSFPKRKTFKKYWHFVLAPVQHQQSTIGLNDEVLTQLNNYKKCLLLMFDKKNMLVVFWEQFTSSNSHVYLECLAVPYTKGQDFPFFFKQALDSIEGNWTTHSSLIKIEKGGLQGQIPKQMKYFYVDFSLGYGYAHVIEDQKAWKRDFVYEVLATALGVQLYQVKTALQFTDEQLDKKQEEFKKMWDHYDWTKCI